MSTEASTSPNGSRPRAALLLLADGRFPAGAYAHSGGLEPTIAAGGVRTVAELADFLTGRLATAGLVAAAFSAAACRLVADSRATGKLVDGLARLEAEYDARTPSPAQRATSRQLGRQLVRVLRTIAPDARLEALGRAPHQPVALGAGHAVLGLTPREAALTSLHETAAGPISAAVRLLSVDPFDTHAVLTRLGPLIDDLTAEAVDGSGAIDDLPACASPLLDVNAERHRSRRTRLFAS